MNLTANKSSRAELSKARLLNELDIMFELGSFTKRTSGTRALNEPSSINTILRSLIKLVYALKDTQTELEQTQQSQFFKQVQNRDRARFVCLTNEPSSSCSQTTRFI